MKIKVGNVIEKDNEMYVVTEMTNGTVSEKEKIEDYIAKNAVIEENGQWKTIKEVIERRCKMYLAGNKIIKQ